MRNGYFLLSPSVDAYRDIPLDLEDANLLNSERVVFRAHGWREQSLCSAI